MSVKTWIDRITNGDDLWRNAIKMEDECNYFEAFIYYLRDSSKCLKQNLLVKAALSCSCAAGCLAKLGNPVAARQLYLEAARIYEENSDSIIKESTRESLWSLQEAYEYYLLGGNSDKAQNAYDKSLFLARKVNPFSGEDEITQNLKMRKKHADETMNVIPNDLQISDEMKEEIRNFVSQRKPNLKINNKSDNILLRTIKESNTSEKKVLLDN